MIAKILAIMVGWMVMADSLQAQNSEKMGSDPAACGKFQSLYQDFYRQGKYKETDPKKKSVLVDSLLWVYDTRIANFGDDPRSPKGYILGLKGIAIQKYRKEDYPEGYEVLGESIRLMGIQSSAAVVLTYMQASQHLFRTGAIGAAKIFSDYETAMDIVEANLKVNPADDFFKLTKNQVDIYFNNSGAATCEVLTKLYTDMFPAHKEDLQWLKKVTGHLKKAGCTDTPLFIDAAEALFKLAPDAGSGYELALVFMHLEKNDKAAEYLQKAIEVRPNWGKPHLLIGRIYFSARKEVFSDPWDQATVLWAATDQFPTPGMVALRNLHDGDTYTVRGWINKTTRVRSKKQ